MDNKKDTTDARDATEVFEEALKRLSQEKYVLRFYIAEMNPRSIQAVENIKRICEQYLPGRYQLEVIDVYQQPIFAKEGQIVAAPTLVKELPPPLRKLVGSMSDTERVLVGMDLRLGSTRTDDPLPEIKLRKSTKIDECHD